MAAQALVGQNAAVKVLSSGQGFRVEAGGGGGGGGGWEQVGVADDSQ